MAEPAVGKSGFRREAGVFGLLYASLGGIVGSGWLLGPQKAAVEAGPLSVLAWVFGGLAILLLALVYAELATMFPRSGAVVHFPQLSHGIFLSRIWSWILFLGYVVIAPVEVVAVMSYVNSIPHVHRHLPALINANDKSITLIGFFVCFAMLVLFTAINSYGIKWAMRINNSLGWWKLAVPALAAVVLLLTAHHTSNLHMSAKHFESHFKGVFTSLATAGVIFSYLGFRQAVELAGESANPKRNLPIAVVGSVLLGLVLYVLLQLAYLLAIDPVQLKHYGWNNLAKMPGFGATTGPFASLAEALGLGWLAWLLYADAVISPSGTGFVYTTTSARVISAMGETGLIHGSMKKLNKAGVPWLASVLALVVGLVFMLPLPSWSQLVGYISNVMALSYGIGPIVLLALRKSLPESQRPRPFRLWWAPVLAPVSFIISNLIIYWGGLKTNSVLFGIIGGLLVIFLLYRLIFDLPKFKALPWRHTWWVLPYFGGLWLLDFIGSPSMVHGRGWLRFPWDVPVVAIFSIIILLLALRSAIPVEELQQYVETQEIE